MRQLSKVESSVIRALAYNKVFRYPLLKSEVEYWMDVSTTKEETLDAIEGLVHDGLIFDDDGYLGLESKMLKERIERRNLGNRRAKKMLASGTKYYRLISSFPFVRAVLLSGSISKNYMDNDGDIDYFIVTEPDRLWITRTFLILFKKIFLLNKKKYFCVNYFVTNEALELNEKNKFTATEILTAIPVYGESCCDDLIRKNAWSKDFYPNRLTSSRDEMVEPSFSAFKSFFEFCLSGGLATKIDHYFQKLTMKRWRSKFPEMSEEDFDLALKSTRRVSKHHPSNYQKKVLAGYDHALQEFQAKRYASLSYEENTF